MTPDGSRGRTPLAVPVGLVLLVGPPGSGKSSFARAWVECGRIDADGVVSCDLIRQQLFGEEVHSTDDPAIFDEMDSRVASRLLLGLPVVVDATNVTNAARVRMIHWARRHGRPTSALRFVVADEVLRRRNLHRTGRERLPLEMVLGSASVMRAVASAEQLKAEGVGTVVDVPGEENQFDASSAAALIGFQPA